jgi:hypothetical protein
MNCYSIMKSSTFEAKHYSYETKNVGLTDRNCIWYIAWFGCCIDNAVRVLFGCIDNAVQVLFGCIDNAVRVLCFLGKLSIRKSFGSLCHTVPCSCSSSSGLANSNPQEGHIIREELVCGPHVCVGVSKRWGVERTITPLFTNNKYRLIGWLADKVACRTEFGITQRMVGLPCTALRVMNYRLWTFSLVMNLPLCVL